MKTGIDKTGFQTFGQYIAVDLTEELRAELKPKKEAPKTKPALFKGDTLEQEDNEKEQIHLVAAVSESIAKLDDAPKVGDKIGIKNGTPMSEVKMEDKYYGVVPLHSVILKFK